MTLLEEKARHIRRLILTALAEAGSGHTGGSLDLVDIFTVLYFDHLRHDPQHPDWEGRDKVVLSIGHTAPVLGDAHPAQTGQPLARASQL